MSGTHVEARVLEADRGNWNTRSSRVLQFKRRLPGCAVIFSKQRLLSSPGQQRPPPPLNQTGHLESLRPHESVSLWWATRPFIFWNVRENKGLFKSCYLPLIWVMTHTHRYRAAARRDNRGAAAALMLTLYLMKIPFICCGFWAAVTVPGRRRVGILLALCRRWKLPDRCSPCDDRKLCLSRDARCLDIYYQGFKLTNV